MEPEQSVVEFLFHHGMLGEAVITKNPLKSGDVYMLRTNGAGWCPIAALTILDTKS